MTNLKMKCSVGCAIKVFFSFATGVVVLLAVVVATRAAWLPAVGQSLLRDDHPAPGAPVLALLMGAVDERPIAAAAAYEVGLAARVVIVKVKERATVRLGLLPSETDTTIGVLTARGVPSAAIEVLAPPAASNTFGEVGEIARFMRDLKPRPDRVILLTSWYHTRRAAHTLEARLRDFGIGDVRVEAVPAATGYDVANWWRVEEGMIAVFQEYVKSAVYVWRYGIT